MHIHSTPAEAWLVAAAGEGVPAALVERMTAALREVGPGGIRADAPDDGAADIAGELAAAAMSSLRDALQRCDQRDAALHLLAADALMTAACQAAAESGTERLQALCAEYDVARLAALADAAGAGL